MNQEMNQETGGEMPDDMEEVLRNFRPVGPSAVLRGKVLAAVVAAPDDSAPIRRGAWVFRSAVAAMLLGSWMLLHMAEGLNRDSASRVGVGPPRWSAEAQQASELLGATPAAREYVTLCLIAGNVPQPAGSRQGEMR